MSARAGRHSAEAALAALGAAALGWLVVRRVSRTGADARVGESDEAAERRHYARLGEGERPFEIGAGSDLYTAVKGRPLEGVEPGKQR